VRWGVVDEVVGSLVEDEVEVEVEVGNRLDTTKEGKVGRVSDGCGLVLEVDLVVVVGAPGLRMFETKDSKGLCGVVVVGRSWRFARARSTGGMNIVLRGQR